MITARQVAADILFRSRDHRAFAAELLDEEVTRAGLSSLDRRFVTQLVFGVLRRKGTLDALLKPFIRTPLHAVQDRVWDVLHLGAFQIAFLTHVPRHAAVHETVELATHIGSVQAKGFLNGVLRRVSELVTDEFVDSSLRSEDSASRLIGQQLVPFENMEAGGRYRKLTQPILPNPATAPAGYIAAAFSWPAWLAEKWYARFGFDECTRLGFWFNAPPPLWIRTNKLHTDRETYRLRLAAGIIDAVPGEHPQSLFFPEHHPIRDLPGYADGDFAVQDHSSLLVASALLPQPGNRILDLCSAPGGNARPGNASRRGWSIRPTSTGPGAISPPRCCSISSGRWSRSCINVARWPPPSLTGGRDRGHCGWSGGSSLP